MEQNKTTKLDKAFDIYAKVSEKFIKKYSKHELNQLMAKSHFFAKNVEDLQYLQNISPNLTFGGIPLQTNDECIIKVVDIEIDFNADLCKGGFSNNERIIYVTYLIINKTQKSIKTISDCPISAFRGMIRLSYLNEKSFYVPSENDVWNAIDEVFGMIKDFRNKPIDFDKISDMSAVTNSITSFWDSVNELLISDNHANINNK